MNVSNASLPRALQSPPNYRLHRDAVFLISALLPLGDVLALLAAGYLSAFFYAFGLTAQTLSQFGPMIIGTAFVGPFILYDRSFGLRASRSDGASWVRGHLLRFGLLAGVIFTLGQLSSGMHLPGMWLFLWSLCSLIMTAIPRMLWAYNIRRKEGRDQLREVIAIVGAGPLADRVVQQLRLAKSPNFELLGVFDDKIHGAKPSSLARTGSLEELIELGKYQKIDWILLTLPCTAEARLRHLVHRLKALSVPIGICPQNVGLTLPCHHIDYVSATVPLTLLADRPVRRWGALIKAAEDLVPRWIVTLTVIPLLGAEALLKRIWNPSVSNQPVLSSPGTAMSKPSLTYQFDNYDLTGFTNIAANFGQKRFGYVVTPNADHLIRLHEDAAFRDLYASSAYTLLDSRFLSHFLYLTKGIRLPVCTGSDLTAKVLGELVAPEDALVLIGGSEEQAQRLTQRYGLKNLAHYNPPMGFIHDEDAVETCLQFIETHSPFRFCLLAVGSPQQEILARRLKERGVACGLALCIGASINFLTGAERRAPYWLQRAGLEWLFRLMQAPGRMTQRYLVRGPRVFAILRNAQIVLRPVPLLTLVVRPSPAVLSTPAIAAQGETASSRARQKKLSTESRGVSAPI